LVGAIEAKLSQLNDHPRKKGNHKKQKVKLIPATYRGTWVLGSIAKVKWVETTTHNNNHENGGSPHCGGRRSYFDSKGTVVATRRMECWARGEVLYATDPLT